MSIQQALQEIIEEEPDFMFPENQNQLLRRYWRIYGDVKADSILRQLRYMYPKKHK